MTTSALPPASPCDADSNANQTLIDRIRELIVRGQLNAARLLLPILEKRGIDPGTVQAIAASIALAGGDRSSARQIIDAALTTTPGNPALLCLRANMKLAENAWVEAALASADAIIAAPQDAHAKSLLGRALLELGKTEQAATCLREAMESQPRDLPTLAGLSRAAPGEAEAALTRLIAEDEDATDPATRVDINLYHSLIALLITRGDHAGATERIRQLAANGKANLDTSLLAVQAAVGTGNWSEVTSLFNTATSHLPRNA